MGCPFLILVKQFFDSSKSFYIQSVFYVLRILQIVFPYPEAISILNYGCTFLLGVANLATSR